MAPAFAEVKAEALAPHTMPLWELLMELATSAGLERMGSRHCVKPWAKLAVTSSVLLDSEREISGSSSLDVCIMLCSAANLPLSAGSLTFPSKSSLAPQT